MEPGRRTGYKYRQRFVDSGVLLSSSHQPSHIINHLSSSPPHTSNPQTTPHKIIMDFVKNTVDKKLNKDAQPGDSVEQTADTSVNQGTNHS